MGVSGVGKTTLGRMLAEELSLPFYDADGFHSVSNKKKMKTGIPLNDDDRESWLQSLSVELKKWSISTGAVLACSALKEKYRRKLKSSPAVKVDWIYLYEDLETITNRIKLRKSHFFDPTLLKSQFETLEVPSYGIHIKVEDTPENSLKKIMKEIDKPRIGLIGLGVMGQSLALNIARNGFPVSVYNRQNGEKEKDIAKNFAQAQVYQIPAYDDLKEFILALETPRNILIMVKSGLAVDAVIKTILPHLQKGDLIMDGGNSHFKDTERRIAEVQKKGLEYIGVGISGGEEGALKGASIMPGGSKVAYKRIKPVLEAIAAKDKNANACCSYIGPGSSGHYIKMVHNGIEYGEMQLIAEFYYFMRYFQERSPEEISEIFSKWNASEENYLLEITSHILQQKEGKDYLIDKILDVAGQKGTGGWTTNSALELGVSLDTITASVMARNISGLKVEKEKAHELYGERNTGLIDMSEKDLFAAYKSASIINHVIGFELLKMASKEYQWKLELSEIARIWTNGCIIRSGFMEELVEILKSANDEHLLLHPEIVSILSKHRRQFVFTISKTLNADCPMQVSSAALNYFLNFIRGNTSANIIQAQRDYFGAHTYERIDKPRGEFFHTNWNIK